MTYDHTEQTQQTVALHSRWCTILPGRETPTKNLKNYNQIPAKTLMCAAKTQDFKKHLLTCRFKVT